MVTAKGCARVLKGDGAHLADCELLEFLLCALIPRVDVKPITKELIAKFGTVSAVPGVAPERLMGVEGVGETAAAYVRARHLLMQQAARHPVVDRPVISNWAALLNYVGLKIRHLRPEQARVLFLDRKNRLIADEMAGQGTVDHAPIYPREIARRALAPLGIEVHDHLVVGAGETVSMKAKGLIWPGCPQWRHSGLAAPSFIARVAEGGSRPQ